MSLIHYAVSHELRRAVQIGQGWAGLAALGTNEKDEMEAFRELMHDSKGGPIHILDEHQVEEYLWPDEMGNAYEARPLDLDAEPQ